ncbi:type II toxin-antitoxin system prevent-host-death family antitoxin [Sinomonas sp. ASV322]|uniref:type II toxin-antitoxin system Phd/YefM family antitoxin n=1 Tax=Sinomonas sp. ASV322 TaxID=3041920 RepID=UPI0027DE83DA|nr:type II toxin-antitoxin system prevent-host-death family antitoxin [Sinomonas sp. ASV322]MDQ4503865.1 type II toxin-antitoxin system prevent-host-death family antitoxin [Sinomonas sp. ASV322]
MRTITQRELRNDNAEVIRAVEQGESFLVTKNGVSVAVLRPALPSEKNPGLPLSRPAKRRLRFTDLPRVTSPVPTQTTLDELREER